MCNVVFESIFGGKNVILEFKLFYYLIIDLLFY